MPNETLAEVEQALHQQLNSAAASIALAIFFVGLKSIALYMRSRSETKRCIALSRNDGLIIASLAVFYHLMRFCDTCVRFSSRMHIPAILTSS